MKVTSRITTEVQNPVASAEWTTLSSRISKPDGSVVFEMKVAEVCDLVATGHGHHGVKVLPQGGRTADDWPAAASHAPGARNTQLTKGDADGR